jgi:hypothetical protein
MPDLRWLVGKAAGQPFLKLWGVVVSSWSRWWAGRPGPGKHGEPCTEDTVEAAWKQVRVG